VEKRPEIAEYALKSKIEFRINRRPGKFRTVPDSFAKAFEQYQERRKSSVRAKVEYAFLLLKRRFAYTKTVYRGIRKNLHRIQILMCSANLLMCAKSGGWREA
jgi:IS5 family transposase